MNHFVIQQSAFSRRERSSAAAPISDRQREAVVCPKPRRLGLFADSANHHPLRSLRWQLSHQAEIYDSKAGEDLLDIILPKGDHNGVGRDHQLYPQQQVATSPPFFCGSPPRRVANPLIQDARFGGEEEEELSPFSPPPRPVVPPPSGGLSASSPWKGGGCVVRSNSGNKPAVRVEGFDCLDRDSRNCSIPALA